MKKYTTPIKFLALAATLGASSLQAQTLLYEYGFNDVASVGFATSGGSNTTSASFTGAGIRGADASGVSGLAGDYAFDNTAPDAMGSSSTTNVDSGARVSTGSGAAGFGGSTSFTVSGWFNANDGSPAGTSARVLHIGTYDAIWFNTSGSLGASFRYGDGSASTVSKYTTDALFSAQDEWIFYAVTYDGTVDDLKVYAGSDSASVSLLATYADVSGGGTNIVHTTNENVYIGNRSANDRPFDGLIDNVAIYTDGAANDASGALSLSALENLRAVAIPEVNTAALLSGVMALFGTLLMRRR